MTGSEATVLVTGGTGVLGRALVPRLAETGCSVRVLSRRAAAAPRIGVTWVTGDLVSGEGLDAALDGATAVVHAATDARRPSRDRRMARSLLEAARRAEHPHVVDVSIVGVDQIPLPYYRIKLEVEQLVASSGLPWTVLRATQFHSLVRTLVAGLARLPVVPVPVGTSLQPVDVADVADRLVELALGPPAGRAPELGGPEVLAVNELLDAYLVATGRRRRPRVPVRVPGRIARAYRLGRQLTPDHAVPGRTFAGFLTDFG